MDQAKEQGLLGFKRKAVDPPDSPVISGTVKQQKKVNKTDESDDNKVNATKSEQHEIQKRILAYVQELELHIKIVKQARIAFDDDEYETTLQQLIQQLPVIRRHRNQRINDTSSSDSSDADAKSDAFPPLFFFHQNVLYGSHAEYLHETKLNPIWKMDGLDTRLLLLQELDKSLRIISENRKQLSDIKYFLHVKGIMSEMIKIPPYRFHSDEKVNQVSTFNNDDGAYDFSYPTMELNDFRLMLFQKELENENRMRMEHMISLTQQLENENRT